MEHIEPGTPLDEEYPLMFKLTKKFNSYAKLLKCKPSVIPNFSIGGISGSNEAG